MLPFTYLGVGVVDQSNPAGDPQAQRRRSTRVVQTVPISVAGTDALGQPFKERTSALVINCHGCKYQSKHYVLKNNWITLEVAHPEAGQQPREVRAQVVWVQRPRTVQELFQVAVALEIPGNIWGVAFPPDDWFPYPEEALPSIPAPGAEAKPPAEAPAAPAGKVRMLPAAPGPSPEVVAAAVEKQVAQMVESARNELQGAVRDAASSAVTAETGKLIREIEAQLRSAARKTVEAVAEQHLDTAVERAVQRIHQSRELTNGALREKWQADFDAMVAQAGQALMERFGESEQELHARFRQQLQQAIEEASTRLAEAEQRMAGLREEIAGGTAATATHLNALRSELETLQSQAHSRAEAVREDLAAASATTQSRVEAWRTEAAQSEADAQTRLRALQREIQAAVDSAVQSWQPALDKLSAAAQSELRQLDQAMQKLRAAVHTAEHDDLARMRGLWREQLETDMALAGDEWNNLVANAVSTASEKLSRQWAEQVQQAGAEARQDMSLRLAALRQSFAEATADAQQVLLAVRRDLEQDLFRAKGSLDELRHASRETAEDTVRLDALRKSVADSLEQQFQQALSSHQSALSDAASGELRQLQDTLSALAGDLAQIAVSHRDSLARESGARATEMQQRADALTGEMARRVAEHAADFQQTSTDIRVQMAKQAGEQLAAMSQQADDLAAESVRRTDELLLTLGTSSQAHLDEMTRQSAALLQAALERIRPELDAQGRQSVDRALGELDRQLTPRMQSGERLLADLAAGQQRAEEFLLAHRERIHQISEEYVAQADRRLQETSAQIQKEWEAVSRTQLDKCLSELEEKSTDASHTTFEALYKAADWYQKKAQTGMQSALEKASEQVSEKLRERAAEVSRMFALELDHYSRSYTEHTKGLLDESAREVVDKNRDTLSQSAQTASATFSDEVHRIAQEKLRLFAEESSAARDEGMAALDAHGDRVQQRWSEFVGRNFTSFQEKIADSTNQQLEQAQRDFQASLLPILESWRADREQQHREWMEKLNAAARESMEAVTRSAGESLQHYQQRLQNSSNTWMVASVTTLNQHSKTVMETLAAAAENRLRDACSQALTGLAQTLSDQVRAISAQFAALPPSTPESPAGQE